MTDGMTMYQYLKGHGQWPGLLAWMQANCVILDKAGDKSLFRPNAAQVKVLKAMMQRAKDNRPIQMIVLKARQTGITTLSQMIKRALVSTRTGLHATTITHKDDSTKGILRMQSRNVDTFNEKKLLTRFGEVEGPIEYNHDSSMTYYTAGGKAPGHSLTIRFLHMTEVSRYFEGQTVDAVERVREIITGIRAACTYGPDFIEIIESTANGAGDFFHQTWTAAVEGRNGYTPIFIAWHDEPHYVLPLNQGTIRTDADLDDEERSLMEQASLSLEQLNWRRWAISDICSGDIRRFREAYPSTPDEAFLTSGETVYPTDWVHAIRKHGKEPVWRGELNFDPPCGWVPDEREDGHLWIYEYPQPGQYYAIGADSAECKTEMSDLDAAVVRDHLGNIVATLHGRYQIISFAYKLAALAWYYNRALVCPEANATGSALIGSLTGALGGEPMYNHLFQYEQVDRATGTRLKRYGWMTTAASKEAAVAAEMSLMRKGEIRYPCKRLAQELSSFVRLGSGKMGAQPGCHDDLVMASAISAAMVQHIPRPDASGIELSNSRIEKMLSMIEADPEFRPEDLFV